MRSHVRVRYLLLCTCIHAQYCNDVISLYITEYMLEAEDSSDEELDANDDPKEDTPTAGEDIEDGYDEEESDEEVPTDQAELLKRIKQLKEV